jgi:RNA polymerase sigma factor (sigma-70 family)
MAGDTVIGGPSGGFPSTVWSDILALRDPAQARAKLEGLIRRYWKPVYLHIRLTWGKSNEEAKDLTQALFEHLLDGNRLALADPSLGSFRSYLKASARNFLANRARDDSAVKRGGGASLVPLDETEPVAADMTPDLAFDREWARIVLDDALARLKERLERGGKRIYHTIFWLEADGLSYREIAERLKIAESDVRNHLGFARRLLRRLMRERIREYVEADAAVEEELRALLSLLKH